MIRQAYWLAPFYTLLSPFIPLYLCSLFLPAPPFSCTFLRQFGHAIQHTGPPGWHPYGLQNPCWPSLKRFLQFVDSPSIHVTYRVLLSLLLFVRSVSLYALFIASHFSISSHFYTVLNQMILLTACSHSTHPYKYWCIYLTKFVSWYCLHYQVFASVCFASPFSLLSHFGKVLDQITLREQMLFPYTCSYKKHL